MNIPPPNSDPLAASLAALKPAAADLNRDGWVDQIIIGMPGEKAVLTAAVASATADMGGVLVSVFLTVHSYEE